MSRDRERRPGEDASPGGEAERFLPGENGALIHYEHAHRYALAATLGAGLRVLDLACGSGYGARLLRRSGADVVALDVDLECARNAAPSVCARGEALPFADASFDCVLCFEAIEHVEEPAAFVKEIARVTRRGGFALLSTPNRTLYSERAGQRNPYHLRELTIEEFRALANEYFAYPRLFAQSVWAGSWIAAFDEAASGHARTLASLPLPPELRGVGDHAAPWAGAEDDPPPAPLYLFAACAHTKRRATALARKIGSDSLLHDARQALIGDLVAAERATAERDLEIDSQARHGSDLQSEISRRGSRIERLEEHAENLDAELGRERDQRAKQAEHVRNLEDQLGRESAGAASLAEHARNLEGELERERSERRELGEHARNVEDMLERERSEHGKLGEHVRNLEDVLARERSEQGKLGEHVRNLEDVLARERSEHGKLGEHVANLQQEIDRAAGRIRSLEVHAGNLTAVIEERDARIAALEEHIGNLEQIARERESRVSGLEAHTRNLELMDEQRAQELRRLEAGAQEQLERERARVRTLESEIEAGSRREAELGSRLQLANERLSVLRRSPLVRLLRALRLLRDY